MGYFNPENYFINEDRKNNDKSLFKIMLVETI